MQLSTRTHAWKLLLVVLSLLLSGQAAAQDPTILIVSDATSAGVPPNNNDDSLVAILEDAGYIVDRIGMDQNFREGATSPWDPLNTAKLEALESADLVIVTRRTNSGSYDDDRLLWNELEVPLLLMSGFISRGADDNRWGWHDSGSGNAPLTATDVVVEPGQEGHPFLSFLPATFPAVDLAGAPGGQLPKAFYLPTADVVPSGAVIARMEDRPFLMEIPAGVDLDAENTTGAGPYGFTGERRVFLAAWGYDLDANDNPDTPYQFTDFTTAEYRCLFLNTVRVLLGDDPEECEEPAEPPSATRSIEADLCQGSGVVVTVEASNLNQSGTIVEIVPQTATVTDPGIGVIFNNTITFDVVADASSEAEVSYELDVPDINQKLSGTVSTPTVGTQATGGDTQIPRCPANVRARVLLVSDATDTGLGNNNDDSLVLMLEEAGYSVDTSGMNGAYRDGEWSPFDPGSEDKVAALEDADLVLVSRRTVSSDYDDYRQYWNEIQTPVLLMSGYFSRGAADNRWGWHDSGSSEIDPTVTTIEIEPGQKEHPFVDGFESPLEVVELDLAPVPGEIPKPFFLPAMDPQEGLVVARMAGQPFLMDLEEGTDLDALATGGGPYGILGARRVLLAAWGYDLNVDGAQAQFTLFTTEEYRCLVLNTLSGMLELGPDPCTGAEPPDQPEFRRGDSDSNGAVNITDGIHVLNFLFLGGPAPSCQEASDANDDGDVSITDGIYILNFLFLGGPITEPPGPNTCGPDPDGSPELGCGSYPAC